MNEGGAAIYVGQVERDSDGRLWAVLYFRDEVIRREQVRSPRQGRRRVTDLVLAAADNLYPAPQRRPALDRVLLDRRVPPQRLRPSVAPSA